MSEHKKHNFKVGNIEIDYYPYEDKFVLCQESYNTIGFTKLQAILVKEFINKALSDGE